MRTRARLLHTTASTVVVLLLLLQWVIQGFTPPAAVFSKRVPLPRYAAGTPGGDETRKEVLRSLVAATFSVVAGATAATASAPSPAQAISADDVDPDEPQTVADYLKDIDAYNLPCPDFPRALEWVNTGPLSFKKELRGKLVLLDMWTYCCINCLHQLPVLSSLEKKYADKPFQVIGVRVLCE